MDGILFGVQWNQKMAGKPETNHRVNQWLTIHISSQWQDCATTADSTEASFEVS
jgi:hypothetical protein